MYNLYLYIKEEKCDRLERNDVITTKISCEL